MRRSTGSLAEAEHAGIVQDTWEALEETSGHDLPPHTVTDGASTPASRLVPYRTRFSPATSAAPERESIAGTSVLKLNEHGDGADAFQLAYTESVRSLHGPVCSPPQSWRESPEQGTWHALSSLLSVASGTRSKHRHLCCDTAIAGHPAHSSAHLPSSSCPVHSYTRDCAMDSRTKQPTKALSQSAQIAVLCVPTRTLTIALGLAAVR